MVNCFFCCKCIFDPSWSGGLGHLPFCRVQLPWGATIWRWSSWEHSSQLRIPAEGERKRPHFAKPFQEAWYLWPYKRHSLRVCCSHFWCVSKALEFLAPHRGGEPGDKPHGWIGIDFLTFFFDFRGSLVGRLPCKLHGKATLEDVGWIWSCFNCSFVGASESREWLECLKQIQHDACLVVGCGRRDSSRANLAKSPTGGFA